MDLQGGYRGEICVFFFLSSMTSEQEDLSPERIILGKKAQRHLTILVSYQP